MATINFLLKIDQECYDRALAIRQAGERDCDPDKYFMAAAEFQELGMIEAAQACINRARHYALQEETQ